MCEFESESATAPPRAPSTGGWHGEAVTGGCIDEQFHRMNDTIADLQQPPGRPAGVQPPVEGAREVRSSLKAPLTQGRLSLQPKTSAKWIPPLSIQRQIPVLHLSFFSIPLCGVAFFCRESYNVKKRGFLQAMGERGMRI